MRTVTLVAALAVALALSPTVASGAKVKHKQTGFSAKVPGGFKLKFDKATGAYRIANRKSYLNLLFTRSSAEADTAGNELLRVLGGTVVASQGTTDTFSADVGVDGLQLHVEIARTGDGLRVVTFGPVPKGKKDTTAVIRPNGAGALTALTPQQLATLQKIVAGARGGRPVELPGDVPLRPFVAPDGSAQAFVPDRPGWAYNGGSGVIEGSNATEGAFAFGVPFLVYSPNDPFPPAGGPIAPFMGPEQAIVNVLPAYFGNFGLDFSNVQVVGIVPGTENVLGPPGQSGMYGVRFTSGGRGSSALMTIGCTPSPGDIFGNWLIYMSYIAVLDAAPAGIGSALLQTWSSWDPSADQVRRRNATIYSILTTRIVGGGPIDPDVFDAANEKWGAYLRE